MNVFFLKQVIFALMIVVMLIFFTLAASTFAVSAAFTCNYNKSVYVALTP